MTNKEIYTCLSKDMKTELNNWFEDFDEIFLHIENGEMSFQTSTMIKTSYAPDEKDILFKKEQVKKWERGE